MPGLLTKLLVVDLNKDYVIRLTLQKMVTQARKSALVLRPSRTIAPFA